MSNQEKQPITATNEILTVDRVLVEGSERYVKCPHCKQMVGLPSGPVRGEQFHHNNYGGCCGWFDVSHDASCMRVTA
jgi:hypothetical protein